MRTWPCVTNPRHDANPRSPAHGRRTTPANACHGPRETPSGSPNGDTIANMTIHDTEALIDAGLLDPSDRSAVEAVSRRYAIALTPAIRALIEAPDDPIARQ